jgi:hypothetical protein
MLRFTLEEELVHFAHGQALGQIVKGTVLGPAFVAVALGFSATGKAFHHGSAQNVWGNADLVEKKGFSLAQSER